MSLDRPIHGPVGFRRMGRGTYGSSLYRLASRSARLYLRSALPISPFQPGQRRMTSRVLLRRTLVLPIVFAAFAAACSDDKDGNGPGSGSFTLGTPSATQVTLAAGTAQNITIPVTFTGAMNPV